MKMKSTNEIMGLVLLCVDEGKEVGTIKDILIDGKTGIVEFLILDDGQWYFGAKVLPFADILGIGSNAVTTETEGNILKFIEVESAVVLAREGVGLVGTKVYTKKGRYIGKVNEFFINEEGGIAGCKLKLDDGQERIIPRQSIITFGKNIIVVIDEVEEKFVDKIDNEITPSKVKEIAGQKNAGWRRERPDNRPQKDTAGMLRNGLGADIKEGIADKAEAARSFEQKQRQFLIGRKVSKRIKDKNGNVLAENGATVTDELIDKIKANGKYIELTMNTSS